MPKFIKLNDKERKEIFRNIKSKIKTWEKFYPKYFISRTMFFNYLSGRHFIPKELFLKWINEYNLKFSQVKEIIRPRYIQKKPLKPAINEKLAELIGAINGDGHISLFNYEICIVCDIREKNYLVHLNKLAKEIFGFSFQFFYGTTWIKLRVYSKEIHKFLIEEYGLPIGNKIGKLSIPHKIRNSKKLLRAYLRGLFDTDGSFYIRRKTNPVVQITSIDKNFLNQIKEALLFLNFKPSRGKNRIFLYNEKQVFRFFKTIKPANSKHLKKFQDFLNSYKRG